MNNLRVEKSIAHRLAVLLAPECGEVLLAFRAKRDGWVKMPEEFELVRRNLGLGDHYVLTYEDELRINNCLFKSIYPQNTAEELKKFDAEFLALSEEEKLALFSDEPDSAMNGILDVDWDNFFPKTEEAKEAAQQRFEALSEEEKKDSIFRVVMFLAFFYSFFYNSLSLMVHGQKLTTLVPLALKGNKEAFCKAVQIDRNLLTGHPYFKETYAILQAGEDKDFLDALLYRIGNPTTRGKLRFPALFMVFATLEYFNWLDDFTAPEIMDICDDAKLDRFQNRIEAENNLIKRRLEYRRYQKISK
jgi:hypothetical protein